MASSLNGPMSILEFTKTNPIQGLLLNRYRVDKTLGKIVHSCEVWFYFNSQGKGTFGHVRLCYDTADNISVRITLL